MKLATGKMLNKVFTDLTHHAHWLAGRGHLQEMAKVTVTAAQVRAAIELELPLCALCNERAEPNQMSGLLCLVCSQRERQQQEQEL